MGGPAATLGAGTTRRESSAADVERPSEHAEAGKRAFRPTGRGEERALMMRAAADQDRAGVKHKHAKHP